MPSTSNWPICGYCFKYTPQCKCPNRGLNLELLETLGYRNLEDLLDLYENLDHDPPVKEPEQC